LKKDDTEVVPPIEFKLTYYQAVRRLDLGKEFDQSKESRRFLTMTTSTLTYKGQTTIPKEIRDYLGVKPQERLAFDIEAGQVVVRRASRSMAELAGSLRGAAPRAGKRAERAGARAARLRRYLPQSA
jgi:antitoxin PrlF